MTQQVCPLWVQEEPFIQMVLARLLRKTECQQKPQLRIADRGWSQPLFEFGDNQGPRLFGLLQMLSQPPLGVLSIRFVSGHKKQYEMEYEGAWIELNPAQIPLLRQWLQLPAFDMFQLRLQDAVFQQRHVFADQGTALLAAAQRLKTPVVPVEDLVAGFASIPQLVAGCMSLRELSASCFWGDSKYLDTRQDLLGNLFPGVMSALSRRVVLAQVYVPPVVEGLLIIENQDTFVRACLGALAGAERFAAVFGAGFRVAADGIRQRGRIIFCYVNSLSTNAEPVADSVATLHRDQFESAWFSSQMPWPVYFFGDLDFAGMGILASLRKQFGDAAAWQPGYDPLLKQLQAGGGHAAAQADKQLQKPVTYTGCSYADAMLIPALQRHARFIDQEYQPL